MIIRTLHARFEQVALPHLLSWAVCTAKPVLLRLDRLPPWVWIGAWAVLVGLSLAILAFRDAATLGLCRST